MQSIILAGLGIQCGRVSLDSTRLAAGCQDNADVVILSVDDRQEIGRFTFKKDSFSTYHLREISDSLKPEKDPTRFAFSPDGEGILIGAYGGILRAVEGGQELRRFGD